MVTFSTPPPPQTDSELPKPDPSDAASSATAERRYCDGCEREAPGSECWRWDRYTFCSRCQEEYITAWAMGRRLSPGQYVRDKRFGEEEAYALSG